MWPNSYLVKITKNWATSFIIKKIPKLITQWAKIRPIWSPCSETRGVSAKWVGLPLNVIFDQDYFLPANEGYNLKWTSLSWQGNLHTNICMFVIWKKYFRRNSVNPISKTYICIMYRHFTHNVRKYVHNTNDWYFLSNNIYIICDTVINLCNK
jgi:hypothetical protein